MKMFARKFSKQYHLRKPRAKYIYVCCSLSFLLILITGWSRPLPTTPTSAASMAVEESIQPEPKFLSVSKETLLAESQPLQSELAEAEGEHLEEPGSDAVRSEKLEAKQEREARRSEHMQMEREREAQQSKHVEVYQEQKVEPESLVKNVRALENPCDGRRVYMYDLPSTMNTDILKNCSGKLVKWLNFCPHHKNHGFGAVVNATVEVFRQDWYGTDAYMLEVIFYERMQTYSCRTSDPAEADLFFIPYFAGLDALAYLYTDSKRELQQGREVVEWLEENAPKTWRRHGGHDHFYIAGRTAWDFCRPLTKVNWWGTSLFNNPEMENTTAMVLERRPWRDDEVAIPYPVGFHPSTSATLHSWIEVVRSSPRKHLFSFSGALRPHLTISIREILSRQCSEAGNACSRLDCGKIKCSHEPEPIYTSLLQATFCLQPRGDTSTRRSVIDSIVSGCIPVFFHEDTAYTQYHWFLPKDYENFSVFIDEKDMKDGNADVSKILGAYTAKQVEQIRERLIKIIPNVLYRHPESMDLAESMRDAFDLTLEGMARKVAQFKLSTGRGIATLS